MEIFTAAIPGYLSVLFLIAILLTLHLIASAFKMAAIKADFGESKSNLIYGSIIGFYMCYLCYVAILSYSGVFQINSIPPRLILFTVLPLLLFLMIVVFNLTVYKVLLSQMLFKSLILMQSFRLVGILFFLAYYHGALPARFAFPGAIGDIVTVMVGFLVVLAIDKRKSYSRALIIFWNCIGLIDIISIMSNAVAVTRDAIATGSPGIIEINNFPLCILPSFAPATIIFLHLSIFYKLWNDRKEAKLRKLMV